MKLLFYSLSIILIIGCKESIDMHQLPKTKIPCIEMPKQVFDAFYDSYKEGTTKHESTFRWCIDTTFRRFLDSNFVSLDHNIVGRDISIPAKSGVRPGDWRDDF